MPPRKRSAPSSGADDEAVPKRRSLRQAASKGRQQPDEPVREKPALPKTTVKVEEKKQPKKPKAAPKSRTTAKPKAPTPKKKSLEEDAPKTKAQSSARATSEESDVDSVPATNPEAPRHDGQWYWLMKAEPETRIVNGIDVKFSIDDLRDKDEPEGWDGIRNYAGLSGSRQLVAQQY
ncbi:hypothetical protein BHE90_001791 [Fusarium euwallaceae]|uniref:EVE domain-containing protein n=1 Tax=Fusarium euwallaceae TaxID=1147111 RepID=A0A430M6M2_9HYPO|nr:hypothetical protein BHE90_001791 [Fusarium euwallaceae]